MRWMLLCLLLIGCDKPTPPCKQGHTITQTVVMPMLVGKVIIMLPMTTAIFVCDDPE